MQYKVTRKDIEESFKFSVDYHLYPSHSGSNRTTGQARGLGGVIDSFLVGKVVEIAVANILKQINSNKEFQLDFDMHSGAERMADPDIHRIVEKNSAREPKIYVEIKNVGEADRWVGLTTEQFDTIKTSRIADGDPEKIFVIFASLKNKAKQNKKKDDLLGVFLKDEIEGQLFDGFSSVDDLIVEIKAIMTGKELNEKGIHFSKNRFMLETEVFSETDSKKFLAMIAKENSVLKPITISNGLLPKYAYNNNISYPFEYGDFLMTGNARFYQKTNRSSSRVFLHCESDCLVENTVLGKFKLEKGKSYLFSPTTIGRNPVLGRNNIWVAKRNINAISNRTVEAKLVEIAEKI